MTKSASNTPRQINRTDLKCRFVPGSGNRADAIDGTDRQTGFAAGAHVFIKQCQDLGELLLRHVCQIL